MNNTLTIEVGKFYKLRNGSKYRCYATDGVLNQEIHGAVDLGNGWGCLSHNQGGRYRCSEGYLDIVSEWTEPYDVRNIPLWAKWVAMDERGSWYVYSEKPRINGDDHWNFGGLSALTPKDYAPPSTEPWTESLHQVDHEKGILIKHTA